MRCIKPSVLLLPAVLLLAGCGNKGPLVLPDRQPAKATKSQTAAKARAQDKATDKKSGDADGRHY